MSKWKRDDRWDRHLFESSLHCTESQFDGPSLSFLPSFCRSFRHFCSTKRHEEANKRHQMDESWLSGLHSLSDKLDSTFRSPWYLSFQLLNGLSYGFHVGGYRTIKIADRGFQHHRRSSATAGGQRAADTKTLTSANTSKVWYSPPNRCVRQCWFWIQVLMWWLSWWNMLFISILWGQEGKS